jgi:pimeloyl-ACP methyl ester carboxylesterase
MAERPDSLWIGQTDLPPRRPRDEIARERRRRGRRRLIVAAIAAALAVAGAIVVVVHAVGGSHGRPVVTWLRPCPLADGLTGQCGRLAVPLDPTDPHGRRISVRVGVIPATEQPSRGALFYLEGGPGGAATTSAVEAQLLFSRIERTRDIVLVDQRGTGGSDALRCSPSAGSAPAAVAAWLQACLARLPQARFFTSAAAAADLEAVRRALGYGRIDLYGASYGATLAQVYDRLYPRSVRSLVLDAASPLGVRVYETQPANAERALQATLASCAATPECSHAYPRLGAELASLLRRPPGAVRLGDGHRAVLDAAAVAGTIEALTHTTDGVAVLPYDVDRAAHGDDAPLAQDYVTYVGSSLDARLRLAMAWEIQCAEPWAADPVDVAARAAGYFRPVALRTARLFAAACSAVPRGWVPAGSQSAGRSDAPALVLAGSADPQSAPDVGAWQAAFPKGSVIVVQGGGHGVAGVGCLPALLARFVEHPHDGPSGCVVARVSPSFELG